MRIWIRVVVVLGLVVLSIWSVYLEVRMLAMEDFPFPARLWQQGAAAAVAVCLTVYAAFDLQKAVRRTPVQHLKDDR